MKKALILIIFSFLIISTNYSQQRTYTTRKIETHELKIDGNLDDPAWNRTDWSGGYSQYEPNEGDEPSQKTEFKILYDENNIYVAIKAFDTEPDKIEKRLSRRDSWDGDLVVVQFDSYYDKKTAFVFSVNAAGVRNDAVIINDNLHNDDDTWDPLWTAKTTVSDFGWSAEMKIPLSQLRFGKKENQLWGLELGRFIFRNREWSIWQSISKEKSGWVSRFGILQGLKNLQPHRQVEIAPYFSTNLNRYEPEEGNPLADGNDMSFNAGIDGKIGITNDLTLDFAVNPDFGQVEADPSEVNLTAFETFFDEKRPFFVEGNNITDFQITPGHSPWSSDNLFYSRRVGRFPQYYIEDDLSEEEYYKTPNNTRIIGAVKLTGKTKKGLSIGIIESLAKNEFAEVALDGTVRKEEVEPLTNYFAGRLQKDMNDGNTILGGMMTSTYRFTDADRFSFLNRTATTGGLDFKQYFSDKKYFVSTKLVGSYITGSEEAMIEQQESSRRYFQRPDAEYLKPDSSLTSLSGYGGNIIIGKQSQKGLEFGIDLTWRSPGIELNDMGFLMRANTIFNFLWVEYSVTEPVWIFREMNFEVNEWSGWDFGGINNFIGGNINAWMQFNNLWGAGLSLTKESDNNDNSILRGGPSMKTPGNTNFRFHFRTNSTKKIVLMAGMRNSFISDQAGKNTFIFGNISYKPLNFFSVSLSPRYNHRHSDIQYVETVTYLNEDKYIFANIDQRTFSLTARIDLNISPDFTIQYYGAPFISAALYSDFKDVTNSKAELFDERFEFYETGQLSYLPEDELYGVNISSSNDYDYYFTYPDFNYQQFRSNLVLRWEYKPGSLLYLVWSQDKTDSFSDGTFDLGNDLKSMFKISSNDVFLIKFSYRFII